MLSALNIDIERIDRDVSATGLALVRPEPGFVELCRSARAEYLDAFRASKVQPPRRPFNPSYFADGPWRKFTIGSKTGVGEAYAQLLQTMYFDAHQRQYPSLGSMFAIIIRLRNQ